MVYIITDGRYKKVGKTTGDIRLRLNGIQTGNPNNLKVLSMLKGYSKLEKALHRQLRNYHYNREWFRFGFDIDDEIAELMMEFDKEERPILVEKQKKNWNEMLAYRKHVIDSVNFIVLDLLENSSNFIHNQDVANRTGVPVSTTQRHTEKYRKEIDAHNLKHFGTINFNTYQLNKNIESIKNAIKYLKSIGKKRTFKNISNHIGIHRNTVSRLCGEYGLN